MKEKIRLFLIKKNLEGLILKKYFFMYNYKLYNNIEINILKT